MNVNYQKARRIAYTVLERSRINSLPIDLEIIIEQVPKLGLITYSKLREFMPTIDKFIASDDGGLLREKKNGTVNTIIAYNDSHILTRCRWTIAHELGHFMLKHPPTHDDNYEIEAHIFAQHLLMPAPLLYDIFEICNISSYYHPQVVAKICHVSNDASNRIIKYFNRINAKNYRPKNPILSKKFKENINMHSRIIKSYTPEKTVMDKYTLSYILNKKDIQGEII